MVSLYLKSTYRIFIEALDDQLTRFINGKWCVNYVVSSFRYSVMFSHGVVVLYGFRAPGDNIFDMVGATLV
jgi:hypothetical protein